MMSRFSWWPLPQRDRAELLDLHASNEREVRRSLNDIARINTWLGGAKPVCDAVWRGIEARNLRHARVLDIGCGNADIARRLVRGARRRGVKLQVVALDINARHLRIAREMSADYPEISFVQADAFALPLGDQDVDIVTSTLFLHHFRAPQIEMLLCESTRVARVGWTMSDTARARLPLWFFRLTRPIFARSFLTRHDAEASIYRAYTREELKRIVAPLPGARVEMSFPYRLSATWRREAPEPEPRAATPGDTGAGRPPHGAQTRASASPNEFAHTNGPRDTPESDAPESDAPLSSGDVASMNGSHRAPQNDAMRTFEARPANREPRGNGNNR